MSDQEPPKEQGEAPHLFVRADEVDAGTSILTPSKQLPLSALKPPDDTAPTTSQPKAPSRPGLRREGSAPPPPPSQPPPEPPAQPENGTDSLSLPQLRQLVSQFPKAEQRAYDFQYAEAQTFSEEVDQWYHYTQPEEDRDYLLTSREVFEQRWKIFCESQARSDRTDPSWLRLSDGDRHDFVSHLVPDLVSSELTDRLEALGCLHYITAGVWSITSGLEPDQDVLQSSTDADDRYSLVQLHWMHKGVDAVADNMVLQELYSCLRRVLDVPTNVQLTTANGEEAHEAAFDEEAYRQISLCFSILYVMLESARCRQHLPAGQRVRQAFVSLEPDFLSFLTNTISRLRWDESYNIPLMHALLLFWKSLLVVFGDFCTHLEKIKSILQPRVDPFSAEAAHPVLTASPLDYHMFRQEITSKYPAYNPPLPLVPLEIDQKSMLPPLPHHSSRLENLGGPGIQTSQSTASRGSILHQPVHIATPAPSPPPSPAGPGGKVAKKQNYQTNQNFPFLYPPLDSSSNNIGGKGTALLQDLTVGQRWEGSDVPTSIIEAGELFASRMRMTRAMRQLWKERDDFMKYDRGWSGCNELPLQHDDKGDMSNDTPVGGKIKDDTAADQKALEDTDLQRRFAAVETYFVSSPYQATDCANCVQATCATRFAITCHRDGEGYAN